MFACLNLITVFWPRFAVFALVIIGAGLPAQCWGHEKTVVAIYNDTSMVPGSPADGKPAMI